MLASCHQDNIKFPATQAHPALGREMDSASQDKLKDMPMERDGRGGQSGCRCTGRGALVGGNRRRPVNPDTNEKLFSARAATRRVRAGDGKQGQHTKKKYLGTLTYLTCRASVVAASPVGCGWGMWVEVR